MLLYTASVEPFEMDNFSFTWTGNLHLQISLFFIRHKNFVLFVSRVIFFPFFSPIRWYWSIKIPASNITRLQHLLTISNKKKNLLQFSLNSFVPHPILAFNFLPSPCFLITSLSFAHPVICNLLLSSQIFRHLSLRLVHKCSNNLFDLSKFVLPLSHKSLLKTGKHSRKMEMMMQNNPELSGSLFFSF